VTTFRDGDRHDRQILQGFRCTRPPALDARGNRLPHDRPWEAEVEAHFHDLKPPGRRENLIRLGFDDNHDLACVVEVERLPSADEHAVPEYFIRAMAVALAHRGIGGSTADAAITDALTEIAHRVAASGHDRFIVSGRIHHANTASQAMARRHGLQPTDEVTGDPYTRWRAQIDIGAEPEERPHV
jgi:hypothetical protein